MNGFHTEERDEVMESITCLQECGIPEVKGHLSSCSCSVSHLQHIQAAPAPIVTPTPDDPFSFFANLPLSSSSSQPTACSSSSSASENVPFGTPPPASTSTGISSLLAMYPAPSTLQTPRNSVPTSRGTRSCSSRVGNVAAAIVVPPAIDAVLLSVPDHKSIQKWKQWLADQINHHVTSLALEGEDFMLRAKCVDSAGMILWRGLRSLLGDKGTVDLSDLPGEDGEKEISQFSLWALFDDVNSCWCM